MDDIAERAGRLQAGALPALPRQARPLPGAARRPRATRSSTTAAPRSESTHDNKQRVAATIDAFYEYVANDTGAFRLVFESDLTNEPAVRGQIERVTNECANLIAAVIHDDTGLPDPASRLLAVSLVGMAQVSARFWLDRGRRPRPVAGDGPGLGTGVARDPRVPAHRRPLNLKHPHEGVPTVEVKIGVQHAPRELILDTDEDEESLEKRSPRRCRQRRTHPHRHQGPARPWCPPTRSPTSRSAAASRARRVPELASRS